MYVNNEIMGIYMIAHARLYGAWKWTLKITELNQFVATKLRNITFVKNAHKHDQKVEIGYIKDK
jgi:hypothetical protein